MRDIAQIPDEQDNLDDQPKNGRHTAPQDALAAALRRGARARQSILAAQGALLLTDEVATRLGLSRDDVRSRQMRGRLLALPMQDGTLGFPSWQFAERGLLPGLEAVLRNIGVDDPWMQAAYFVSGERLLAGQTPLDVLRRGDVEAVRKAAAAYGEPFAS